MAIATAKKIFQSLPSDFDDIIEKFAEEQRMEAALTLSDMVRSGSVEQYRQYFVQSPRGLSLEDEFETATEKPPIPEKAEWPTSTRDNSPEAGGPAQPDEGGLKQVDPPDFTVRSDGDRFLVTPQNEVARRILRERVDDQASWFGDALVVEHRYIQDIVAKLNGDGFIVSEEA